MRPLAMGRCIMRRSVVFLVGVAAFGLAHDAAGAALVRVNDIFAPAGAEPVEAVARPRGLADHLAIMADDLEGHQRKEESILFPTMLSGSCGVLRFPISRMMSEHDDVYEQLARLAALTKDFTPPQGACQTWRALSQACKKLDRDLREHMRLENDVLFPHFL